MWTKNHDAEIAALRAESAALRTKVAELETVLATERVARMEDKLSVIGKMADMHKELADSISKIHPQRSNVKQFSNARDWTAAVEREEGISA